MSKDKFASLPRAVRIDDEVHEHLMQMADRQHRSMSNLIGLILLEAVEKDKADLRGGDENL